MSLPVSTAHKSDGQIDTHMYGNLRHLSQEAPAKADYHWNHQSESTVKKKALIKADNDLESI